MQFARRIARKLRAQRTHECAAGVLTGPSCETPARFKPDSARSAISVSGAARRRRLRKETAGPAQLVKARAAAGPVCRQIPRPGARFGPSRPALFRPLAGRPRGFAEGRLWALAVPWPASGPQHSGYRYWREFGCHDSRLGAKSDRPVKPATRTRQETRGRSPCHFSCVMPYPFCSVPRLRMCLGCRGSVRSLPILRLKIYSQKSKR